MSKINQFVIIDHDLKSKFFEDFAAAFLEAVRLTSTERMTIIQLPDGREFTILQRPQSRRS